MSIQINQNDVVRQNTVARKLLNGFDWNAAGYPDKFTWLREVYGPKSNSELLRLFREQFAEEGLL